MARHLATVRSGIPRILTIGFLLFAGLMAAACSASGGYGSTTPNQAPAVAGAAPVVPPVAATAPAAPNAAPGAAQDVQAELTEFTVNLSSTTVKAGHVRFNVSNTGKFSHALEITGQGIDIKTQTLSAGQAATLEADLVPGKYEVWCPVGNHKDRGMDTSITVQ